MAASETHAVPSAAEIVARAKDPHALLSENAGAGEQERRVPERSIGALT